MTTQKISSARGDFLRKAEGLYQYESSGAYYARFRHRGQRIFERLGSTENPCNSLPEAKRLLRDLKNRLDRVETQARKKTLKQILNEFELGGTDLEGREFPPILSGAPKTISYKLRYLKRIREDFPVSLNSKIVDVKKSDVRKFLAHFNDSTADHYNHVLTLLREIFEYAVDDMAISDSPVDGIKYRKREDVNKKLTPSWSEFEAIVASIRAQVYADTANQTGDLVQFMGEAGLGQAECSGLRWGHISFEKKEIVIIRQKTRTEFRIIIYPWLHSLLERMNRARGEDRDPEELVFKVRDPKKALGEACKRLKLPPYSPRSFRRMFIDRCQELGWEAPAVAITQGHRDGGQTILKHYAKKANVARLHELVSRMSAPTPAPDPAPTAGDL